jgi:hypothetical protein
MVLTGFADADRPDPLAHDLYKGEEEHVVWSVPPQAAAGLTDRVSDWERELLGQVLPSRE